MCFDLYDVRIRCYGRGALITGAAGVVYGALKKSWKVMLGMWLGTLICGCFFVLLKLH